ncbi:MAG: PAS domain-containing protein [Anaerolineae bacterium]|nr:PAS domain-containing protein [Anaerolineae bacterium]
MNWLIEPVTFIDNPERRRQARLLSSLLLALVLVSTLSVIIDVASGQLVLREISSYMPIFGVIALLGVYGLSRTRHYTASAATFVGILFIIIHIAPIFEVDSPGWLYYAVLPILLSCLLFSLNIALVVAAVSIGSMLLLIIFVPGIKFDIYWLPVMYTVIITAVVVTFMRHRDLVEMDRQLEVKQSQQMLELVLNSIPIRVFWKDKDLKFLGGNHLFAQDVGLASPAELVGKNDFDLAGSDRAACYQADDRLVMESNQPKLNYEKVQTAPTGTEQWLQISKIPFRDPAGNIAGVLGIYDDITARKQVEIERERLQQEVIEAQQRAIAELSTPVIPIMDRIIVMPLMGSIDSLRARNITRSLLAGISQHRAKVVILDVTGVGLMDTGIVNHLNKTIQAAQLKGAQTIVTGISDAVAEAIVDLGIDWSGVTTLANLQTGLMAALDSLGIKLTQ